MARRRRAEDDDLDDDLEEDEVPRGRNGGRSSVRPWDSGDKDASGKRGPTPARHSFWHRPVRRVYFRARDSIWFEPLVALMIILLLLVSLWAYTGNWPPLYVVESSSMQHGSSDQLSLINAGDLVLAKQLGTTLVTPYVVGAQIHYSTYGEFGDVLLYHPNGDLGVSPIIHRALIYLVANGDGTYSFPSLIGQSCGLSVQTVYSISSQPNYCGTDHVSGTLILHAVGWQSLNVSIPLGVMLHVSGFVTMGDGNFVPGNPGTGEIDQPALSGLVESDWMLGVARGMIPWIGAIKLAFQGQAQYVPSSSWWFLGLSFAAIVLLAFGIHYALRRPEPPGAGGPYDADRDDTDEDDTEGRPPPGGEGKLRPLRSGRGRPRPHVRRGRRFRRGRESTPPREEEQGL